VFSESISAGNDPRQDVFRVIVADDDIYEEMESFTIILELDQFVAQSTVIVDPNVTRIDIIDNDGNYRSSIIHLIHDLIKLQML
jgi:hypothetical protein